MCHHAECHYLSIISCIKLGDIVQSVIMLSGIMLSVIILSHYGGWYYASGIRTSVIVLSFYYADWSNA